MVGRVNCPDFTARCATHFRESEVEHFHEAVRLDFDIGGFQIAMGDSLFVRGIERVRNLLFGNDDRFVERNRLALCRCAPPASPHLHQFHDEVVGANVVESADVGVVQGRNRPSLSLEALAETFGGDFDGDVAAQARVSRARYTSPIPPAPMDARIS